MKTLRSMIKHVKEPFVYVIEGDEDGVILAALDVTAEANRGGLCNHTINDLPLAGQIDDIERIQRERADQQWEPFEADCGNVHHLMADLLAFDREYRAAASAYAMADSRAKSLKKDMEARAQKVLDLLARVNDRKPLPLFESIGG